MTMVFSSALVERLNEDEEIVTSALTVSCSTWHQQQRIAAITI